VFDFHKKQPRKIEVISSKKLICQEAIIPNILEEQTKDFSRIGNDFIRNSQVVAKNSCQYFCDYMHINDPQCLVDINKDIYEDLIKNQVNKYLSLNFFIFIFKIILFSLKTIK